MRDTIDESVLIAAVQRGDQVAFAQLVDEHTPVLLRVARGYVPNHAVAEAVVQETWIALVKSVANFEGRSSLRTWLLGVVINVAMAQDNPEQRDEEPHTVSVGPTVDPSRFFGSDDARAGAWTEPPVGFPDLAESSVLARELRAIAELGLDQLRRGQREVVMLRDMIGLNPAEVEEVLAISPADQRVLLHRGRAAIRQALENHVKGKRGPADGAPKESPQRRVQKR